LENFVLSLGLSAWAELILNFAPDIAGVRPDPQGSWSTKHVLFVSFLDLKEKAVSPLNKNRKKK